MEHHFQTPALRAATLRDHQAILEAIAAHDPRAARKAMRRHLTRVAQEFTHGFAGGQRVPAPAGGSRRTSTRRSTPSC